MMIIFTAGPMPLFLTVCLEGSALKIESVKSLAAQLALFLQPRSSNLKKCREKGKFKRVVGGRGGVRLDLCWKAMYLFATTFGLKGLSQEN